MARKTFLTIIVSFFFALSYGASVKIEIENGTNQEVTIMVGIVIGADAIPRNYRSIFQLKEKGGGSDSKKTYQNDNVERGATIFIYAVLAKGGKTQPQEFKITQRIHAESMLVLITTAEIDNESSVSDIMAKFKDFSKTRSNYHETIDIGRDETFKSIFGSMIITDKDSSIVMRITAKSLKSDRSDYKLTGQDFNIQRDFKREAMVKLNGSIPLAADLSYMFGNSEMSSFTWSIKNAGFIPWSHPEGKTEIELFYKSLDSLTLNYLADLYLKDSSLHMYFIDRAYLIESYTIKSSSFKKLTSDAEINVTIYGSGSSNYVKSSETLMEVTKTNIITDIWGSDHSDLLRQNSKIKLARLKKSASTARDTKTLRTIYDLLKLYDGELPDIETTNLAYIKKTTLDNIEIMDDRIKYQKELDL